ncbi:MAG: DUF1835 domain-containing protein [Alphaproteobacteria bacterium]|nr:DUF1835 domain-containing protein [Alphaproteobacteria bacterium]
MTSRASQFPLHLVLGDHGAARVAEACRRHGLPGAPFAIPDDPSHGPLGDGVARLAYMQALYDGFDEFRSAQTDAFAPWRALSDRLDVTAVEAIVLWGGDNASEGTFLRMACDHLADRTEPMLRVEIPPDAQGPYVGMASPERLAELFATRRPMSNACRASLAAEFARLRDDGGLVRRWDVGGLRSVAASHYDALIIAACSGEWTSAARVVGDAMRAGDRCNRMSDLFFASRLRALVASGDLELDRPPRGLRSYAVRRAPRARDASRG